LQPADPNSPVTKAELKAELADAVKQLKEYIDERTFDAETRLLRGFEKHAQTTNLRMRT
jgi:hypothetical protein